MKHLLPILLIAASALAQPIRPPAPATPVVADRTGPAASAPTSRFVIQSPKNGPATVKLIVQPAPAPKMALKYRLLPTVAEQEDGNAAQYYYLALSFVPEPDRLEKIQKLLELSPQELAKAATSPPGDVAISALQPAGVMRYMDLAARRSYCHWDFPTKTEGISLLLPSLGSFRNMQRMLVLRTRLRLGQGEPEQALHDLQTALTAARHMSQGPTLIQGLVGVAMGALAVDEVGRLIAAPDAPNMYWALSELPQPFIDLGKAIQWESEMLFLELPELRDPRSAKFTRQQWQALPDEIARKWLTVGMPLPAGTGLAPLAAYVYPAAKRYLLEEGLTKEQVEAMPVQQALAIYLVEQYRTIRDDMFKWFALPYWQAHQGMAAGHLRLEQARQRGEGWPLTLMLPTLGRAYRLAANLDRRIAALRCVEAVRMYAADNAGKLPQSLDEVKQAPLPIDPVTGKGFVYEAAGNSFSITGPALPGEAASEGLRFEVKVEARP